MENIKVVIPPQEFKDSKYLGIMQRCYLEEALDKAGYIDSAVGAGGFSKIKGNTYIPKEAFNVGVVQQAFKEGKSVEVELIPIT